MRFLKTRAIEKLELSKLEFFKPASRQAAKAAKLSTLLKPAKKMGSARAKPDFARA